MKFIIIIPLTFFENSSNNSVSGIETECTPVLCKHQYLDDTAVSFFNCIIFELSYSEVSEVLRPSSSSTVSIMCKLYSSCFSFG